MEALTGLLGVIGVFTIIYIIGLIWLAIVDPIREIKRTDVITVCLNGMFVIVTIGYIYLTYFLLYKAGILIFNLIK